jgi:type I restriction enzyme S subunit
MKAQAEWKEVVLRDICESVRYGYTAKAREESVGPKFLRITDIVPDLIDWSSVPYCEIPPQDIEKYKLHEGDIVIARTGATTGYAKWIKKPPDAVFASYLVRIRIAKEHDNRYIGLVVESGEYKRFIKANIGGAAQPNANAQILTSFPVLLPPLPTQRKIAAILSAYDDLIENNTRRIAILEEMAQALYREWFVHFRFPGYEQVAMVDSELGLIPEGWEVVKLASIAAVNAASIRGDEFPEQINYVNISSVSTGRIEKIEPMALEDAPSRARRIVGHGDIIWSTVRPNRKSYCLILDPVPNMIVSTGFAVITARQVPYTYLYHALTTDEFVAYLTNNATGAAYPAVNTGDFENADVLLPAGEPMQTFHNIVVNLFDEKQNLHKRNEVLRRTRDLLLPRLISGEVDVSELEIKDLTGFENLSGLDTGGLDQ